MRSFFIISLAAIILTTLCACPYSSPYRLDDQPQQYVDETLLGNWAAMVTKVVNDKVQRIEPVKLILSKRSDMEYNIAITGYINELKPWIEVREDTIKGIGFLSNVADRRFLNFQVNNEVFIAEVKRDNNGLSFLPMAERFTPKLIKNNAMLRLALEVHYKTKAMPSYDEDFILKGLQKVN